MERNRITNVCINGAIRWLKHVKTQKKYPIIPVLSACKLYILYISLCLFQAADPVSVLPASARCKVDPNHMLGIVGIVATFLNLLVVVLVYMYTPIWRAYTQTVWMDSWWSCWLLDEVDICINGPSPNWWKDNQKPGTGCFDHRSVVVIKHYNANMTGLSYQYCTIVYWYSVWYDRPLKMCL